MSQLAGGKCWNCSSELSSAYYGRGDTCPRCGKDTRVCKGCGFYDRTAHNECHESQADRVVDKEKANFCDFFKPGGGAPVSGQVSSKDQLRLAAEKLFKK